MKWLLKIICIAILAVSPMIFLIYKSSIIIDRQMQQYMVNGTSVAQKDTINAINELTTNMSIAYTYTFIIVTTLIIAAIVKLFLNYYNKYKQLSRELKFTDTVDALKCEEEIDEALSNAKIHEYNIKNTLKMHNRGRMTENL